MIVLDKPFWNSPTCQVCGGFKMHSSEWDAYYCARCNQWLESKCSDPDCEFCSRRPDRPGPTIEDRHRAAKAQRRLLRGSPPENQPRQS